AEARQRIEAGRRRGAGPAEPARGPGARATGGGPRCRPARRARLTPGRHAGRRAPPDRREGSRSMATRPRAGSKPSLADRWAGTGAIGYKLSSEEFEPRELVRQAARAEESGFGFAMISDHFHPWTDRQGQSPFVWATLGGIAQATERLTVSTGVTCPLLRIHPAIVAQAAATVAAMMPGRFGLGVGAGENLNEHVAGAKWPPTDVRHEMLKEAVTVIRRLWEGGLQDFRGRHYQVDNARLYTLPEAPPPILVAASGPKAAQLAGRIGDGLVTTEPDAGLVETFRRGGAGARPSGPLPAGRRPPPSPGALSTRRGRAATHPQPASLGIEWSPTRGGHGASGRADPGDDGAGPAGRGGRRLRVLHLAERDPAHPELRLAEHPDRGSRPLGHLPDQPLNQRGAVAEPDGRAGSARPRRRGHPAERRRRGRGVRRGPALRGARWSRAEPGGGRA